MFIFRRQQISCRRSFLLTNKNEKLNLLIMVKITTRLQFEMLVQKMEAHPNVARGVRLFGETKATFDEVWKDVAEQLNSCGPPTRTPDEWHRVWTHFKSKLKKKMSQNKKNITATGGGPSQEISLSSMEQAVADLLQINMVSNPAGAMYGIEETWDDNNSEIGQSAKVENERPQSEVEIGNVFSTRRKRNKPQDQKIHILKEQTATQNELLKSLTSLESAINKQNDILTETKNILTETKNVQKKNV
ncbi:uncharacterized protein [Musca autumnalis]|uniref:uncharacterized protein n=1 Tax=Musca autumnalis TaxID=221902 RepID=UPI003CEE52ED